MLKLWLLRGYMKLLWLQAGQFSLHLSQHVLQQLQARLVSALRTKAWGFRRAPSGGSERPALTTWKTINNYQIIQVDMYINPLAWAPITNGYTLLIQSEDVKKKKTCTSCWLSKRNFSCLSMLLPLVHVFLYEHSGVKASAYATLPEWDGDDSGLRTWLMRAVDWSASDRDCLDFRRCTARVAFRAFRNKPRKIRERFVKLLRDSEKILLTGSVFTCMVLGACCVRGSLRHILLLRLLNCSPNSRL